MKRQTFDFGIDLGTTNSAIALLEGVRPRILKNQVDADITPSAVHINKRGEIMTGTAAKNKLVAGGRLNTQIEFKRMMGTDHVYTFKDSGQTLRPEDLAAEVLKALRLDAQRATGELPTAAVITVPAAFEAHQCSATLKAGELAGFAQVALLQEPVAAALAYGFQSSDENAYWLVFDFGGGTFDAALIKSQDGSVAVIHHAGDNFLGGSNIDWVLIEKVVLPKIHESIEGSEEWLTIDGKSSETSVNLFKLKYAVESAKIQLSSASTAGLDVTLKDTNGNEHDCSDITITLEELTECAYPLIDKAIDLSKKVLSDKGLKAADVAKLVLVGGPTKAEYFRERLRSQIGIPVDHSVDTMTVVACGAAIFAGTQKVTHTKDVVKAGEIAIDLKYEPVGSDPEPMIGGRILDKNAPDFTGWTLQLTEASSRWMSPVIQVKKDGTFMTQIKAEAGRRNTFTIEIRDAVGSQRKPSPENFSYTIGAVAQGQPLMHDIGIGLNDNTVEVLFKAGSVLPARKKARPLRSTLAIKAGDANTNIRIPLVEGSRQRADRQRRVGDMIVTGAQAKRDLPIGAELDVEVRIAENHKMHVLVFVGALNTEFEQVFELRSNLQDMSQIRADFAKEDARLIKLEESNNGNESDMNASKAREAAEELRNLLKRASTEEGALAMAESRLIDLKVAIDLIEDAQRWPTLEEELKSDIAELQKMIDENLAKDQVADDAKAAIAIANLVLQEKRVEAAQLAIDQIAMVTSRIRTQQPQFWVGFLRWLESKENNMQDKAKSQRLFELARQAIQRGDLDVLRTTVMQLRSLLPPEEQGEEPKGIGSDVI